MSMLHFPRWRGYVSKAEVRGEGCDRLTRISPWYGISKAFRLSFH